MFLGLFFYVFCRSRGCATMVHPPSCEIFLRIIYKGYQTLTPCEDIIGFLI